MVKAGHLHIWRKEVLSLFQYRKIGQIRALFLDVTH